MNLFQKIKLFSNVVKQDFRFVFSDKISTNDALILTGQIVEIEIKEDKARQVKAINAKAVMEIANNSKEPVMLINPEYYEQSSSKNFAITEEDDKAKYYKWYSSHYPRKLSKEFIELVNSLKEDKKIEKLLTTLEPNEKTYRNEEIHFEFDLANKKRNWQDISWINFRNQADSFWLSFSYHLPEEIYLLKPKLIKFLPDLWKDAGEMPLACWKDGKSLWKTFSLKTEPIFIDFTQTKSKINEM